MQPELSDVAESVLLRAYHIAVQPGASIQKAVFLRGGKPLQAGNELTRFGLAVFHPSGRLLLTPLGVRLARALKGEQVKPIDLQKVST
jgi:hypothetical protein